MAALQHGTGGSSSSCRWEQHAAPSACAPVLQRQSSSEEASTFILQADTQPFDRQREAAHDMKYHKKICQPTVDRPGSPVTMISPRLPRQQLHSHWAAPSACCTSCVHQLPCSQTPELASLHSAAILHRAGCSNRRGIIRPPQPQLPQWCPRLPLSSGRCHHRAGCTARALGRHRFSCLARRSGIIMCAVLWR